MRAPQRRHRAGLQHRRRARPRQRARSCRSTSARARTSSKGDLLFSIDPRPYQAALAQAEAALARDRAQLENAQTDVKRYDDLVKKDYVTQQQYDSVKANAAAYAATVRADEAAVERARLDLAYCSIRSPHRRADRQRHGPGRQRRQGQRRRRSSRSTRSRRSTSPSPCPSATCPRSAARQAQGRLAVDARGSRERQALGRGELTFIDNTVDRTTGTITLKATFANADRVLWPGEFVNAVLTLTTDQDAIVAPLRRRPDRPAGHLRLRRQGGQDRRVAAR